MKDRLTEPIPPHRLLREILRHYTEYRAHVSRDGRSSVLNHSYMVYPEDEQPYKIDVSISFLDLQYGIKELSPRKREALWYNVILDKKQKDVAEIMGITTVSVGQYVEQACLQLADRYFAEETTDELP